MAESGSGATIAGFSSLLIIPVICVVLVFALAGKANGSSAEQPINTAPGSSQATSLTMLQAYTDPSTYLTQNASQITNLSNQAALLLAQLKSNDSAYAKISDANRQAAITTLTDITSKLQQLQQHVAGGAMGDVNQLAQSLASDVKQLNNLLPSVGAQLNVPIVVQGDSGWCGRTAMDMIALYYTHGQIPSGFDSSFNSAGGILSSAQGNNVPSPDTLSKMSGKSGWVTLTSSDINSADQLFTIIKASIDGGDPVLMYTKGVYYSASHHIVAVSGYDAATKTIIANNPIISQQGGTRKNTRTSTNGSNQITSAFVYSHIQETEQSYGHVLIVQSRYAHAS